MDGMITIGSQPKAIKELVSGILAILKTNSDQATIQVALDVLKNGTAVSGTTISSCTLTSTTKE